MKKSFCVTLILLVCGMLLSFLPFQKKPVKVFLIGDSTVADYSNNYDPGKDYMKTRYPIMGWGQVFQSFLSSDSLSQISNLVKADSALVVNKARGGRSTRTFFEEGRWREVKNALSEGDLVLIQFGHNDAAENKPERYVNVEGYKEYLRLYVNQAREKGAIPLILTPVTRNYPWENNKLSYGHGEYREAAKEIAGELNVPLIDLTRLSADSFSAKGKEYVTQHYFMNLPAGKYEAYPEGQEDNTHFQPEGAREVARLVFEELQKL